MSIPVLNTGTPWRAVISADGSPNPAVLKAAVAGKEIVVTSYVLIAINATATITFKTASTAISGAMVLAAAGDILSASDPFSGLMSCVKGQALNLATGDNVEGHISGVLI